MRDKIINTSATAKEMARKIGAQREEIIAAFIAKYKVDPAECVQEFGRTAGGTTWRVRKMRDDERESASKRISAWIRRWLFLNIYIDFGFLLIRTQMFYRNPVDRCERWIGMEIRFIKWRFAFDLYRPEIQRR